MGFINKGLAIACVLSVATAALAGEENNAPFLPTPPLTVSTVPANGDVNPYGVAFVPIGFPTGSVNPGDVLVSNFNNSQNLQGTGTTIVRIPPTGPKTQFFGGTPPLGLSTALVVLKAGLVLVGNVPTADGTCATVMPGSILVLDANGNLLQTLTDPTLIDGPWDATVEDLGNTARLFVSNVLSGTVARFDLSVASTGVTITSKVQIGSGYSHRCDPAALVVGPTGLVYDAVHNNLAVASTEDNEVFLLGSAANTMTDEGTGSVAYSDAVHLHGPLAMAAAPNGDLLVSNSDVINADPTQPSEIVEFTKGGKFVRQLSVDPIEGGAFGMATNLVSNIASFAAVDDNAANLTIYTIPQY
ncbi:MAG TPA: hypothetical protein VKS22_14535 [Candidatus Binataceae bacterium]|nr:hypothetical protein [Candidatus Binataceae bacterium]